MNLNPKLLHSAHGINYFVTTSTNPERPYGISAQVATDCADTARVNGLFFTEEEAAACCKWLAENEVYPVTLCEVLENLYVL